MRPEPATAGLYDVGETGGAVDGITELWYNSERDLLDAYAMSTASAWPPTRSPA